MFSRITVNKSWIGQLGAKEVRGLTSDATHNGLTPIRHIMSVRSLIIATDARSAVVCPFSIEMSVFSEWMSVFGTGQFVSEILSVKRPSTLTADA